jgi:glycosyltransferase involved in cell wall biosynthesis
MRCALLAYDVPGCREIVKTGQNGALVRPGDVDALATTLVDWLSDDARRTALGTASRAVAAEHFAVGTIAEQYADLYRSLLGVPR